MKIPLLLAILAPAVLMAQSAPPLPRSVPPLRANAVAGETLPNNYELTLSFNEEPAVEISLVVASTEFAFTSGNPGLTFSGQLSIEESGHIVINYNLGWGTEVQVGQNVQYKTSSTRASVRLQPGEDIQMLRAGNRTVKLSIKKLPAK